MALAFATAAKEETGQPEAVLNSSVCTIRPVAIDRSRNKASVSGGERGLLHAETVDAALLAMTTLRHDRPVRRMSDEELEAVACGGDFYVIEFDRELLVVSNAVALTTLLERR